MKQRGFSLLISLIILLLMVLLGVVLLRNVISDQNASGNVVEKQRAIEAAQTGLDAVQFWMTQPGTLYNGIWNTGVNCSADQPPRNTPVVCSNALANPTDLSWASSANAFQPPASAMPISANGGLGTYAATVKYSVQFLGTGSDNPPSALYKVTTLGTGGNDAAKAVIESVFQVQVRARDTSGS